MAASSLLPVELQAEILGLFLRKSGAPAVARLVCRAWRAEALRGPRQVDNERPPPSRRLRRLFVAYLADPRSCHVCRRCVGACDDWGGSHAVGSMCLGTAHGRPCFDVRASAGAVLAPLSPQLSVPAGWVWGALVLALGRGELATARSLFRWATRLGGNPLVKNERISWPAPDGDGVCPDCDLSDHPPTLVAQVLAAAARVLALGAPPARGADELYLIACYCARLLRLGGERPRAAAALRAAAPSDTVSQLRLAPLYHALAGGPRTPRL